MRLSSIVSLVVVTASFALGGCAYGESADIGSEGPEGNVVHSHAGAPDQGRISDLVKVGNDKVSQRQMGTPVQGMIQVGHDKTALQIGKPAALPVGDVSDIDGITGKLGFVPAPGSVIDVDGEGLTIPSLKTPFDPGMKAVIPPGQLAGIDLGRPGLPTLNTPGGALDPAMNVVPVQTTGGGDWNP